MFQKYLRIACYFVTRSSKTKGHDAKLKRMYKLLSMNKCNYVFIYQLQRYLYISMLSCNCDLQGQGHELY